MELIDNNYLRCYTPTKANGTSKAQIVRKFTPYGVLKGYEGVTAFLENDIVTVSMKMYLKAEYLTTGNIYFLDFENSMMGNAGIRFFFK